MEKLSLRDQRKISLIFFPFHYCQFLIFHYNVSTVLLVVILKEISRERNPLNNYLSVQGDLLFGTKVSCSKVNKVRGHLLNKHAILEIGLLVVLAIGTLLY